MLCNTVEVFGGDTWNEIPENTRVVSSLPSIRAGKSFLPAMVAVSLSLSFFF